MPFHRLTLCTAILIACSGCAKGLNSYQSSELKYFEASGKAIEEKDPDTAALLGILPGGGSFYGRSYGFGILNLLLWPISICWDPFSGINASESINYYATKAHLSRLKEREIDALDEDLQAGKVNGEQYAMAKRKIERKYTYNPD